jgi:hypothetical protein
VQASPPLACTSMPIIWEMVFGQQPYPRRHGLRRRRRFYPVPTRTGRRDQHQRPHRRGRRLHRLHLGRRVRRKEAREPLSPASNAYPQVRREP